MPTPNDLKYLDDYANRLRSAEAGDAEAQLRLGQRFLWGENDIPLDRMQAIYWFQKSAENGNVEAMFRLGWCMEFGFGKDEDHIAAMKYYRQAAEGGNSKAMDRLGRYYLYGDGIPQDAQEAARWFWLAAEKGDHLFASIAHCPLCGKSLFEKPLLAEHGLFSCSECSLFFPRRSNEAIPQTPRPHDSKIVIKYTENELVLELPPKGPWADRNDMFLRLMCILGNLAWLSIPVLFFFFGPMMIRLLPKFLTPLACVLGFIAGLVLLAQVFIFFIERWSQKRYKILADRFVETEAVLLLRNTEVKKRDELIGVRADEKAVYLDGLSFVSRIETGSHDEARWLAYEIDRFYRLHPCDVKKTPNLMDRLIQGETPSFSAECPSCGERYRFQGESFRCGSTLRCRNCLQYFPCFQTISQKRRKKTVFQGKRCQILVHKPKELLIRSRLNWNVGRLMSGLAMTLMLLYTTGLFFGLGAWPFMLLKEVGFFSIPISHLHPGAYVTILVILLAAPLALLFVIIFYSISKNLFSETFLSWNVFVTDNEIVYSFGTFRKIVRRLPLVVGLHVVPRNDHRRFALDHKNPAVDQEFAVILRIGNDYFGEIPCINTAEVDRICEVLTDFLSKWPKVELSEDNRDILEADPEIESKNKKAT